MNASPYLSGGTRGLAVDSSRTLRRGFTLLEGVLVLLVISLLATLLLPSLGSIRESSRQTQCRHNLSQIVRAAESYSQTHGTLPPLAHWRKEPGSQIDLHLSQLPLRFVRGNWATSLLPYLDESAASETGDWTIDELIASDEAAALRTSRPAVFVCPSDAWNTAEARFRLPSDPEVAFARGNYGINGGPQCHRTNEETQPTPNADPTWVLSERDRFAMWGSGIAGVNVSFDPTEFENASSSLVAFNELRAGIHEVDPRGVWTLGHIASSATWANGVAGDGFSPNSQWPNSDDIQTCEILHRVYGPDGLLELGMPCVDYVSITQQATPRSSHPGLVQAAFLDGSVRVVGDGVDPSLWHAVQSRRTRPAEFAESGIESSEELERQLAGTDTPEAAPGRGSVPVVAGKTRTDQSLGEVSEPDVVGMRFVSVPAGRFVMAADNPDGTTLPLAPPHEVVLPTPYEIGVEEVSLDQWTEVMGEPPTAKTASPPSALFADEGDTSFELVRRDASEVPNQIGEATDRWSDPDRTSEPATSISWYDAVEFCRRLTDRGDGYIYRLPTEAEWEYACRLATSAGSGNRNHRMASDLPSGESPLEASPLIGINDEVREWVADRFDRDYYRTSPTTDPTGPTVGLHRFVRGGLHRWTYEGCPIDYCSAPPNATHPRIGVRIVRVPSER